MKAIKNNTKKEKKFMFNAKEIKFKIGEIKILEDDAAKFILSKVTFDAVNKPDFEEIPMEELPDDIKANLKSDVTAFLVSDKDITIIYDAKEYKFKKGEKTRVLAKLVKPLIDKSMDSSGKYHLSEFKDNPKEKEKSEEVSEIKKDEKFQKNKKSK